MVTRIKLTFCGYVSSWKLAWTKLQINTNMHDLQEGEYVLIMQTAAKFMITV